MSLFQIQTEPSFNVRSRSRRGVVFLLSISLLTLSLGCSDGKPKRYTVKGNVSFNGVPVSKGEILISPIDGRGRPDAGRIVDGTYEFKVTPGQKRVEITAASTDPALVGELPQMEGINPNLAIPREYIPARYNEDSELTLTIEAIRVNEHSFELTSPDDE